MATHFHIFKLEEDHKLKIMIDIEIFGKTLSVHKKFDRATKPELKVYGCSIVHDKLIVQLGDETTAKMFVLPWRTEVDYQVKFMGRDGRMVTILDEDVLKDGSLAQRILAENLYLFKHLTSEDGRDKIELRYITFELATAVGAKMFRWLRRIRTPRYFNVVLIQKFVNGELVEDGYHILNEPVEHKIEKYIKEQKLKNNSKEIQ
jgi:hypothetical protein